MGRCSRLRCRVEPDKTGWVMKNFLTISLLVAAAFAGLTTPENLYGKGKKSTPPPEVDTSDRITALHLTSVTVTIHATHASKEYKVTPTTKITVNGQPGTLSSLATGMDVTVTPAGDPTVAAAIEATSPKK